VLCDSMQVSIPKNLDSPEISITTVQHSDDEVEVRRGLEGMADADICESEILKQSSRSLIRRDDLDNSLVKPARNNNYL
jgi:hypothetical protein